jgi:hypothetical protein
MKAFGPLSPPPAFAQQVERANAIQSLNAASSGYAETAEGLRVRYD